MRFRLSLIVVSLLLCALEGLGQQAAVAPSDVSQHCLSAPALPPQLRGTPGLKLSQACKPALSAAALDRNGLSLFKDHAKYVSFDFPGSLSGITADGVVVGTYADSSNVIHGWIRYKNGDLESFDDPSAVYGTFANGINDGGVVTGTYWDINQQFSGGHGYVGKPGGNYITFDVPGDTGWNGTVGTAINVEGSVAGSYQDASNNEHGFLREPWGTITTFDVPANIAMSPSAINLWNQIVGYYYDPSYTAHAFLRNWNGAVNVIDPPAGTGITIGGFGPEIQSVSINPEGRVAGTYWQPIQGNPFGGNQQGFGATPTVHSRPSLPPTMVRAAFGRTRQALLQTGQLPDT